MNGVYRMSGKYGYNRLREIPAPIIDIKITNPALQKSITRRGKIDTGADLSAIPYNVVEELALEPMGMRYILGYNRTVPSQGRPLYYVDTELAGYIFKSIQVIGAARPDILIGRNILNNLTLVLKGKSNTFEISDP